MAERPGGAHRGQIGRPPTGRGAIDTAGEPKELRPGTVETIRTLLAKQREFQPSWLERYFPGIPQRGSVEYADIEQMTPRQADAMRHNLIEQIIYAKRQIRKIRGRGSPTAREEDSDDTEWPVRAQLYDEALRDLCETFGLRYPMPTEG